jgi:HAD superfamily hydrolase (TIGR01509 family)
MKEIRVIAFDCDGVLFDTERANRAYYNEILAHFDRSPMTPEQFAYVHAHTFDQSMAYLFDHDEAVIKETYAYRETMDYDRFLQYLEIEPHLKQLLQKIRPRFKTAIATNRTDTMDQLLAEFDLSAQFDLVVTCRDVLHPKPDPEPLLKILDHFGEPAGRMVYIGDSQVDQRAAHGAEVRFVAYRNQGLDADFHIQSLEEMAGILGV